MIAAAEPDVAPAATSDSDDLVHIVCCDPDRAECSLDVSGATWAAQSAPSRTCVVCVDINRGPNACCPEESINVVVDEQPAGGTQ